MARSRGAPTRSLWGKEVGGLGSDSPKPTSNSLLFNMLLLSICSARLCARLWGQEISGSQPPDLQEQARRRRQAESRPLQRKAGCKPAPILHEGQPGKRGPGLSLRMMTRPPGEEGEGGHFRHMCGMCPGPGSMSKQDDSGICRVLAQLESRNLGRDRVQGAKGLGDPWRDIEQGQIWE